MLLSSVADLAFSGLSGDSLNTRSEPFVPGDGASSTLFVVEIIISSVGSEREAIQPPFQKLVSLKVTLKSRFETSPAASETVYDAEAPLAVSAAR